MQEMTNTAQQTTTDQPGGARAFWRGRLVGVAGIVVMVSLYFGTVVWFGNDLADQVKAGTREVRAGMMVPDLEG